MLCGGGGCRVEYSAEAEHKDENREVSDNTHDIYREKVPYVHPEYLKKVLKCSGELVVLLYALSVAIGIEQLIKGKFLLFRILVFYSFQLPTSFQGDLVRYYDRHDEIYRCREYKQYCRCREKF